MSATIARIRRANSRRRFALGLILGAGVVLTVLFTPGTASAAAATCSFAGNTLTVTLNGAPPVTIARTVAGQITVSSADPSCTTPIPGATVTNTDTINVTSASGTSDTLTLDESNGQFAPGNSAETGVGNVPEIEINYTATATDVDILKILGQTGTSDTIVAGQGGIDLNNDTDPDVSFPGGSGIGNLDELDIFGQTGDDTLSAAGDASTGAPLIGLTAFLQPQVIIHGDEGADNVQGGDNTSVLNMDILCGDDCSGSLAGDGADTINGDSAASGVGGDDTITGGLGNDIINADDGNDIVNGNDQNDTITGGAGNDQLHGGEGVDNIDGGSGNDTIDNAGGADVSNADTGFTNTGNTFTGDTGNDWITGGALNDTLSGGDNSDRIEGGAGDDILNGNNDNDSPATTPAMGGVDTTGFGALGGPAGLFGDAGNDTLHGNAGQDDLHGGANDDQLWGDDGNDVENGELGDDTYHEGALPNGSDVISDGLAGDTTAPGTGPGADKGANTLDYASRTVDVRVDLTNFAGTFPASGDDGNAAAGETDDIGKNVKFINTGSGNDVFNAAGLAGPYVVDLDGGQDAAQGSSGNDIISGGPGNDDQNTGPFTGLNGGPGNDVFLSSLGNDIMNGDAGDDIFCTGTVNDGNDKIDGGTGSEILGDAVTYANTSSISAASMVSAALCGTTGRTAAVTINNNNSTFAGTNYSGDQSTSEQDVILNTVEDLEGTNFLQGGDIINNSASNVCACADSFGDMGNDTLGGNSPGGIFNGGDNADRFDQAAAENNGQTLNGDSGFDTADYSARTAALDIDINSGADDGQTAGPAETDDVTNTVEKVVGGSNNDTIDASSVSGPVGRELWGGPGLGNDTLTGSPNDDSIYGQDGNDSTTLNGGAGNDFLDGGLGNDIINGQAGNDVISGTATTSASTTDQPLSVNEASACPDPKSQTISGFPAGTIRDVNVHVDVVNTSDSDEVALLLTHDGVTVRLTRVDDGADENSGDWTGLVFDDEASTAFFASSSETGRVQPGTDPLSALDEHPSAGTWTLTVDDQHPSEGCEGNGGGILNTFSIDVALSSGGFDGQDDVTGGDDTDLIDYSGRTASITATLGDGFECCGNFSGGNDGQSGENDNIGRNSSDVEDIFGGSNNDILTGANGVNNWVRGNAGDDLLQGLSGNDHLQGDDGNDTLAGGLGTDLEDGNNGNDNFNEEGSTNGDDTFNGGAGSDELFYNNRGSAVTVWWSGGAVSGEGGEGDTVNADVEIADGGAGNDIFKDSSGIDGHVMNGNGGNDTYVAQGNFDNTQTFNGDGTGAGGFNGSTGAADFADYGARTVNLDINVNNAPSPSTGTSGEQDTLNTDVENVDGGSGNDHIVTGVNNATVNGNDGNDNLEGTTAFTTQTLNGNNGNDTIDGGDGNDFENGGPNNDTFNQVGTSPNGADDMVGGSGTDTVSYAQANRTAPVAISNDNVPDDGETPATCLPLTGACEGDNVHSDIEILTPSNVSGSVVTCSTGPCTITGGTADDILNCGVAACTANGGNGNDILTCAASIPAGPGPTLNGDAGNDDLLGCASNDNLNGGTGDDKIQGQGGGDFIFGNAFAAPGTTADNDTIWGDDDLQNTTNVLTQVSLVGIALADTINGDNGDGAAAALGGDDQITGGPGNENGAFTVFGNGGNDTFYGEDTPFLDGADSYSGQGGTQDRVSDERRQGGGVTNSLDGVANDGATGGGEGDNDGNDVENLTGSPSADVLTGNSQNNDLVGLGGNDVLNPGTGDDTVEAGDGQDVITAANGNDTYNGGNQADTVTYATFTSAVTVNLQAGTATSADSNANHGLISIENVTGSPLDDTITGDDNSNVLNGGGGIDHINGRLGDDTMNGGFQTGDELLFNTIAAAVTIDHNGGTVTGQGNDTISGFTNYVGSSLGDLFLSSGDFTNNTYNAGGGIDTIDFSTSGFGVTANLTTQQSTGPGTDVLIGFENINGSPSDDILTGNSVANQIVGNAGNDWLDGAGAADMLIGGDGNDTFSMGSSLAADGAGDNLSGGNGTDTVTYNQRTGNVTIRNDGFPNSGEAGEGDVTGIDIENETGGAGNDTLVGNTNNNVITGNDGNDTITAANGQDTLNGGNGNDILNGGYANDTENGGNGNDVFYNNVGSDGSDVLVGGAGIDTASYGSRPSRVLLDDDNQADDGYVGEFDNVRSDVENMTGGNGSDRITGNGSANSIRGGNGNDTLTGGASSDTVAGEGGNDVVLIQDGEFDRGNGGTGSDCHRSDAGLDALSGFERAC